MKVLKIIGIILLIIIGLPLIISFFLPSKVHVERSLVIKAPESVIFDEINDLKKWGKWSPWHKKDPNMKITYEGESSGKGASYTWFSKNKNVEKGKLTITESIPYDSVATEMDFMENGKGWGAFALKKEGDGVKVTWSMESDMGMNPIGKWFGLFMDKMVGPDFEEGLKSLEEVSKQETQNVDTVAVP